MAQSFYPTALQVIDRALIDIGAVDPESGITPTTTQRTDALQVLNFLVTSWIGHGMQVWCQKQGTYVLTAASSYTVGPGDTIDIARPLDISYAWLRDTDATPDIDTPLRVIGREEYIRISQKETTGTPSVLFYDRMYDLPGSNSGASAYGKIHLWPVPDAAAISKYDLYFIYTRPLQDFSATSDTLDFPQEWFNAVRWNLAVELTPAYQVPLGKLREIKTLARDSLALALATDRENVSITISPASETNS